MGEIAEHITNQMQAGRYHSSKAKENKMQVTGTIQSVFATQEGGYQSSQGDYIYTFDMAINTPQGPINGEIGSKTQPYPLAVGQQITVEVSQTDRGPRLKKINPQYAGQQGQGPPQQRQPQRQPQQANKPDWDEIARGKVRCNLICAVLQGGQEPDLEYLNGWMDFVFTGNTGEQGGRPNPDYNPNPEHPAPGDDVPF